MSPFLSLVFPLAVGLICVRVAQHEASHTDFLPATIRASAARMASVTRCGEASTYHPRTLTRATGPQASHKPALAGRRWNLLAQLSQLGLMNTMWATCMIVALVMLGASADGLPAVAGQRGDGHQTRVKRFALSPLLRTGLADSAWDSFQQPWVRHVSKTQPKQPIHVLTNTCAHRPQLDVLFCTFVSSFFVSTFIVTRQTSVPGRHLVLA